MKDNKQKTLVDNIIDYVEEHQYKSIVYMVISMISIIAFSAFIMQLIVNNDIKSGASNDGWISFYGGVLGGMLGGIGTIIAVLITTIQSKNHQKENLIETRKIQRENSNQISINNLNNVIKDIREKLDLLNSCMSILDSDKMYKFFAIKNSDYLKYDEYINVAKNVINLYDNFMKICGNIGTDEMVDLDKNLLIEITNYQELMRDLIEYYIKNGNSMGIKEVSYINDKRKEVEITHKKIKLDISDLRCKLQCKIYEVSEKNMII